MPRYLTPSRLCLLVLVDIYLSGRTASTSRLDLLSFIAGHINIPSADDERSANGIPESATGDASAFALRLRDWSSAIPGRTVYDVFLQHIWNLTGLDSLHALFDHLAELTAPVITTGSDGSRTLSRASPLGQFIRRCGVEFTRLQFADSQALWDTFEAYRAPTYDSWEQKHTEAASKRAARQSLPPPSVHQGDISNASPADYISAEETDNLVTFSIHQLQKLGTRVPDGIKQKLEQWVTDQEDSGSQSLQHFLAFFEYWRAGQYTMALESLHRYFDYSLVSRTGTDNMRVYYQYALLHLSVLHADFDFWEESVDAMDECIATARENQDAVCLNFALSWLLYLRQAHPANNSSSFGNAGGLVGGGGGEQDEIALLKTKAKETKHWSLMSSTLLEEAKLEMYHNGSTSKAFEHIIQSAFLNLQHDLRSLMSGAALFHGASMERLDLIRATCRIAYGLAQGGQHTSSREALRAISTQTDGVLKLEQRIIGFITLGQLSRCLHRDDFHLASLYLSELRILRGFGDPEIAFEIDLVEIDLHMKKKELEQALKLVNTHLRRLKHAAGADIAQRLHLLVLKSRIFAIAGRPAKGFSLAMRAASIASRNWLMPVLMEACSLLGVILNDLSEFEAARGMVSAIIPLTIEARNVRLTAQLFTTLGEAYVGIAGNNKSLSSEEQMKTMRMAEVHVERSREAYVRLEDFQGMQECLVMLAQIAKWRGDENALTHTNDLFAQLMAEKDDALIAQQ